MRSIQGREDRMKRLIVQLDAPVHERLKRLAFTHQRSMASIVREMVRTGLNRPLPPGRRREDVARVVKSRSRKRRA